jgi:glycine cleavage system H protein
MAVVQEGYLYAQSHEWVAVTGDLAKIGITDYAQSQLGDLVYAEATPAGRTVKAGQAVGVIESVKVASDIYSPVSGEIVEVNPSISQNPENINSDPYGSWFVVLRLADPAELDGLLDAAAYAAFCEAQA